MPDCFCLQEKRKINAGSKWSRGTYLLLANRGDLQWWSSRLPQWPLQLAFIPKRCTDPSQRKSLLNEIHCQAQNPDSAPALLWAYTGRINFLDYYWLMSTGISDLFLEFVWFSSASDLQQSSYPAPHVAVTLNGLSIFLVIRIFLYSKEKKSNCNLRLNASLPFFPAGTKFLIWVYWNTNEAT